MFVTDNKKAEISNCCDRSFNFPEKNKDFSIFAEMF